MDGFLDPGQLAALTAFAQVVMIDLVLAGDNAVAVGLAAAGLPAAQRKKVILWGLIAAVVMRIGFALITTQLLAIIGLLFAGGLLLLWVCWKMWRELHEQASHAQQEALSGEAPVRQAKTFREAFTQILIADLSMSLDNVLAVAGAAHGSYLLVVAGLVISVPIVVWGSTVVLKVVERYPGVVYIGAAVLVWTAVKMITGEPAARRPDLSCHSVGVMGRLRA